MTDAATRLIIRRNEMKSKSTAKIFRNKGELWNRVKITFTISRLFKEAQRNDGASKNPNPFLTRSKGAPCGKK